jgi:hypothetical protein
VVKRDRILEVGIDDTGSFYIRPETSAFPYVYREAMEVGSDPERRRLFSPPPREWSYLDWFNQLRRAAEEQGVILEVTRETSWANVPETLGREIDAARE